MKYNLSTLNEVSFSKNAPKFDLKKYSKEKADQLGGAAIGYGLGRLSGSGKLGSTLMAGVGAAKKTSGFKDDVVDDWEKTKKWAKHPIDNTVKGIKKAAKENLKDFRNAFDIDDEQNKKDSTLKSIGKVGYKIATSPITIGSSLVHAVPGAVIGAGLGTAKGIMHGKHAYEKVKKDTGSKLAGLAVGGIEGALGGLMGGSIGTIAGTAVGGYAGYKNAKHYLGKPIGEKHDDKFLPSKWKLDTKTLKKEVGKGFENIRVNNKKVK